MKLNKEGWRSSWRSHVFRPSPNKRQLRLYYSKGSHWTAGRKCECLDHTCAPLHIASHLLTNPQNRNFTSVQADDLRRRLEIIMEKFRTSAIIVTLHLFKQAIWEDMCNITFGKIAHMQLMWLMWLFKQAIWEDMCNISFQKISHAFIVTLHTFKKAIWGDLWKLTFQKTYMTLHLFKQVIWEDICNLTFGKIEVGCGGLRALQKVPKRALVRVDPLKKVLLRVSPLFWVLKKCPHFLPCS